MTDAEISQLCADAEFYATSFDARPTPHDAGTARMLRLLAAALAAMSKPAEPPHGVVRPFNIDIIRERLRKAHNPLTEAAIEIRDLHHEIYKLRKAAEPPQDERKEVMQNDRADSRRDGADAVTGAAHPNHAEPPQDVADAMAQWLHKWPGGAPNGAWSALSAIIAETKAERDCLILDYQKEHARANEAAAALAATQDAIRSLEDANRLLAVGMKAHMQAREQAERERDGWKTTAEMASDDARHFREKAEQAERERDEALEDAERYRWLRLRINSADIATGPEPFSYDEASVDAAVDAARGKGGEKP